MQDRVIINCGYLKDGYVPVTARIWISEGSLFLKFSNQLDDYCLGLDKFKAVLNLLEGNYDRS